MLTSALLYLRGAAPSEPVIRAGVALAKEASARVRGLTLIDTRHAEGALHSESAVYADLAHRRIAQAERRQQRIRRELSHACLEADLNFDVRRLMGDPLRALPQESQLHDLVVTSLGQRSQKSMATTDGSWRHLQKLLMAGVQPLLVVPPEARALQRVLLVYDGSESSGRAIRAFLDLGVLADAEYRLLAIGPNETAARHSLREMADYCMIRRRTFEAGWARGSVRRVLAPFAAKWQADLIVLGVERRWWRRQFAYDLSLIRKLGCGLLMHC